MASRDARSPASGPDVVAAGAVVYRRGSAGREVLLVHRPKYDDWAFPKGKQDPGEHVSVTGVREVLEETGLGIALGRPLLPQLYVVSGGRAKKVHYWIGRVRGDDDVSGFSGNSEIDELGWFAPADAVKRLTYLDDTRLLEEAESAHKRTTPLVILRHGRASSRKRWKGDDTRRPLTKVGREQSRSVIPVLEAYAVRRAISSDSARCAHTLKAFGKAAGVSVERLPELSEEKWTRGALSDLVREIFASPVPTVLCTHRPVVPTLLHVVGISEEPLAPGEMLVCHHRHGRVVAVERHLAR